MDEGLKDVLLAILTLAFPAMVAFLDSKRKKARKAQVKAHPVTEEEIRSLAPDSGEDKPEEAVRTSVQPPQEEKVHGAPAPAISEEPRLSREEKRKLIIYSEIMKPKYDE